MANPQHLRHRDQRLMRGVFTVRDGYTFELVDEHTMRVQGGQQPYEVTVHPEWAFSPTCTCPDFVGRGERLYCKHIVAVLSRDERLRCQLLEMFL
jgi:uncharacterized Zn finger protein